MRWTRTQALGCSALVLPVTSPVILGRLFCLSEPTSWGLVQLMYTNICNSWSGADAQHQILQWGPPCCLLVTSLGLLILVKPWLDTALYCLFFFFPQCLTLARFTRLRPLKAPSGTQTSLVFLPGTHICAGSINLCCLELHLIDGSFPVDFSRFLPDWATTLGENCSSLPESPVTWALGSAENDKWRNWRAWVSLQASDSSGDGLLSPLPWPSQPPDSTAVPVALWDSCGLKWHQSLRCVPYLHNCRFNDYGRSFCGPSRLWGEKVKQT